ncbi:MAG: hypothetical protein LBE08_11690 [Bifidobacteriaceae bacterium]|jgi:hypothetical protein|nr:hypothetical protein [Bifidobacteriaceae bacterium]
MMETLMLTFHNATEPDREEEMRNWYNWVHIRDVAAMPNAITAVQRLGLASAQPDGADLSRKYLTIYEVADKTACSVGHTELIGTRKLLISTAFDRATFAEGYWDIVAQTASFAAYADYKGDKSALAVRLDGGAAVEAALGVAELVELASQPGVVAAHLACRSSEQQANSAADTESASHVLVAQLDDSYLAARSWDAFAAAKGLASLKPEPVIYQPIIDRFSAADAQKSPEWQAITYLSHAIMGCSPDALAYPTK